MLVDKKTKDGHYEEVNSQGVILQHFAIELMDDEPIDKSPVSEKDFVKDTPVKTNGRPKPAQNATNDPVASKSANNPLIKIASKLENLLRRLLEPPVVLQNAFSPKENLKEKLKISSCRTLVENVS